MTLFQDMGRSRANRAKIESLFEGEAPYTKESLADFESKLAPEERAALNRINERWAAGNQLEHERREAMKALTVIEK